MTKSNGALTTASAAQHYRLHEEAVFEMSSQKFVEKYKEQETG